MLHNIMYITAICILILSVSNTIAADKNIKTIPYEIRGEDFLINFISKNLPLLVRKASTKWPIFTTLHNENLLKTSNLKDIDLNLNSLSNEEVSTTTFSEFNLAKVNDVWFEYKISDGNPDLEKMILLPTMIITCQKLLEDYKENGKAQLIGFKSKTLIKTTKSSKYHKIMALLNGESEIQIQGMSSNMSEGDLLYIPAKQEASFSFLGKFLYAELSWFPRETHQADTCNQRPSLYNLTHSLPPNYYSDDYTPKTVPNLKMNTGFYIPPIGLGTARLFGKTYDTIKVALSLGYLLIDTAQIYSGEEKREGFEISSEMEIGRALSDSGTERKSIFLLSKVDPDFMTYEGTITKVMTSLSELRTDYLDAVLVHDFDSASYCGPNDTSCDRSPWICWRALEELQSRGVVRSIGVSNIKKADLVYLAHQYAKRNVSIVQNWFDPLHQDQEVRRLCEEDGIVYMGYSTLGAAWSGEDGLNYDVNPVLKHNVILTAASSSDVSPAVYVLRWAMEKRVVVIPCSSDPEHLEMNLLTNHHQYSVKEFAYLIDKLDNELGNPEDEDWDRNKSKDVFQQNIRANKDEL